MNETQTTNDPLGDAIKILAAKIKPNTTADEALKYTQATLNLAHAIGVLANATKSA